MYIHLHKCIHIYIYIYSCCLVAKSCLTFCDPINCSPPGSSVHEILQARIWSGLSCPPPWDLPDPRIKAVSLMSPALTGGFFTTSATWEVLSPDIMWSLKISFDVFFLKEVKEESEVVQSCPTLCDPMDCSLPGSSIREIF